MSRRTIARRVESGQWQRLFPAVFFIGAALPTDRQRIVAAMLWAGPEAALSHRAAAAWWRFDAGSSWTPEITVPRPLNPRHPSIVVHRVRDLRCSDITESSGIALTTPTRTLIDLATILEPTAVELALDGALRDGLTSVPRMRWYLDRVQSNRRPGLRRLRRMVEARADRRHRTESGFESLLLSVMRKAGLPDPVTQYVVRSGRRTVARIDVAYPELRIAIEADSRRFHGTQLAFEANARRQSELAALGWIVMVVTWHELTSDPVMVVDRIRRAIKVQRRAA